MITKVITKGIVLFAMVLLMASCGEQQVDNSFMPGQIGHGKTKEIIQKHIDSVEFKTWNKAAVSEIQREIDSFIASPSLRRDMSQLLKLNYCKSMENELLAIMRGTCKESHNRKDAIYKELQTFDDLTGQRKEVKQKYDEHAMLEKFISGMGTRQKVNSLDDRYDEQHETNIKKQANSYLQQYAPTCTYIKKALSNPDSYFEGRRKAFCQDMVNLYLGKSTWTQGDENKLKGRILFYTNKHPHDKDVVTWMQDIDDFKRTHSDSNLNYH